MCRRHLSIYYLYTIIWALPATASLLLEPILHVFQALFCAFPLHLSCSKNTFVFSGQCYNYLVCGVKMSKYFHYYLCSQMSLIFQWYCNF